MFKAILVVAILIISGCTTKTEIFRGNVTPIYWGEDYNRVYISLKECNVDDYVLDKSITLLQIDTLGDTLNISENTIFRFNYNATQDSILIQLDDKVFFDANRFQATGYSK